MDTALITNEGIVLGLLALILAAVFYTQNSSHSFWQKFYRVVPALLLCYFIPSLLNTFDIVNGETSGVAKVVKTYLLPACLVLLTLSLDLKAISKLGWRIVVLFFVGTFGILIGGPIALLIGSAIFPELIGVDGPEAVWRGMTTIAGSWIGGGANQLAMKETYEVGNDIFSAMVTVDIIIANIWMAVLLYLAANHKRIDANLGADVSAIDDIRRRVEHYEAEHKRNAGVPEYIFILAAAFGAAGIGHFAADLIAPYIGENYPALKQMSLDAKFLWVIMVATAVGIALSFTRVRKLEGAGASKIGSVMIYFLVASIGLSMDITAIADVPKYFVLGAIWMIIHAGLIVVVARLIKAPTFYMAVASQANVGGAASAPVVASAFHPSLASVGVLLAVLGYAVGTYVAYFCGQVLRLIAVG
ncbi:hypothetical protein CWE22_04080 [Pseudidiomarina aestuarii]|uniref:DUF819 domain-containing protein n=2 Tax=Pseudidiomarina aestuarii TaxID=624146 RepID=A0A7Z7EU05_9GAMM|nr:DUF819 family protein [Pseudidiomarina aestuarii]RUO41364.1 hypothetical protein CWE22_04080 [Pseudidiomarina aestuarii]